MRCESFFPTPSRGIAGLLATLALAGSLPSAARADLKMPSIFGDHMVLQQGIKLPVWGKADPGEQVAVSIGDHKGGMKADENGRWKILLEPLPNGATPTTLEVRGANQTLKFSDVLVGDVWFCSGQSNMGYTVGNMPDAAQIAPQATDPLIRYYQSGKEVVATPQDDCPGRWVVVSPATVRRCSAVSYFMATNLQAAGHGPVGLIIVATGGIALQSFMSLEALQSDPAFRADVEAYRAAVLPSAPKIIQDPNANSDHYREEEHPPSTPTVIYNGSIHPLIPYGLKGIVFYHGASNTRSEAVATLYRSQLIAMIRDWRKSWGQGDIPFIIEQINPTGGNINRAFVRNSQLLALSEPKTGLCVSIDIGEKEQQHFADKSDIGLRMALAARELAYGENVVGFGPIYQSATAEGTRCA